MNILLLNDTEGHYHFGCTGTSKAVKAMLSQFGQLIYPTHRVMDSWSFEPCPNCEDDFYSEEFFQKWCDEQKELKAKIEKSDVCVVTGEGTIMGFNNRSGTRNLLYLMYICKQKFHKKVMAINGSCFPVLSPEQVTLEDPVCRIYKKVYENLDFCAVRERKSLAILEKLGCHAVLAFDCLPLYIHNWFHETSLPENLPPKYILLNGGSVFFAEFEDFINHKLWQEYQPENEVFFITADMPEICKDDLLCLKAIKRFNRKIFNIMRHRKIKIVHTHSVDKWLSVIKNATLLISGRFHHSVAATVFETPFVVFEGNTPKNSAVENVENPKEVYKLSLDNFQYFYNIKL